MIKKQLMILAAASAITFTAVSAVTITGCQPKNQGENQTAAETGSAEAETLPVDAQEETSFTLVKGETFQLEAPEDFKGTISWTSANNMANVGSSQKKYPLSEGESDGDRTFGIAASDHLLSVDENGLVTALEKGNHLFITAKDQEGREKTWEFEVRAYDRESLPKAEETDYKALRNRYVENLTGGENDLTDPDVKAFVEGIDKEAKEAWDSYAYKGKGSCESIPWAEDQGDGTFEEYKNDAVKFRKSYQKVEKMARAYCTAGSELKGNKELLGDITAAMDWLSANCYYPRPETDNWWTWEIGLPKNVLPIVLYLYDDLTEEQRDSYTKAVAFFQPDPFHSGIIGTASTHANGYREATSANLMDCAYTAIGLGLVYEDGEYLNLAKDAAATTMTAYQVPVLKDNGHYEYTNGFYEDGSYIDHFIVPYGASYGTEFLKGSVQLINLLGNSPWTLEDENVQMLENYITKGYIPAVYNGVALDMLRGRAIARPELTDRDAGQQIMEMIVKTIDVVSPDTAAEIKSAVKHWTQVQGEEKVLSRITDVAVLNRMKEIMADSSIDTASMTAPLHRIYPLIDRTIHQTSDYLFGLSMYSSRISNCEIMNDENLKGWYTGFGMTYLYNSDLAQYTDNYWNTINACKLPGTTVVPVEIDNGEPDSSGFRQSGDFLSPEDWVGGTSVGSFGVSGMSLNGTAMSNGDSSNTSQTVYADSLRARKSYFMFDNEIVCLGSGITNKGFDIPTITTVENRKLKEDKSNQITIDGKVADLSEEKEIKAGWLHLEGNTDTGSDLGYYFPGSPSLRARVTEQTGSFHAIKGDLKEETEPAVRQYFECWFDHGTEPAGETYSYVLLPGMSADQVAAYSAAPEIEILENSEKVQAVKEKNLKLWAADFWTDETITVDGVTCKNKASVMMEEANGVLTISVSDPTWLNTDTIELAIEGRNGTEVLESHEKAAARLENGKILLSVSAEGLCGSGVTVKIKVQ